MDFQSIFEEYYTQYRGDSQIPDITDPEWAIAVRYGNGAIRRWANVDTEEWEQLWTTASVEGFTETYKGNSATPVTFTYDCPDTMKRPGGFITLTDPVSGSYARINVIKQTDVQWQASSAPYAYFTGDENTGFFMTLNFTGNSNYGWVIDFPIYKKPTYFDASSNGDGAGGVNEDGTTISECPDSNYIINYILAWRFRSSRNFPAYQTAKADAEEGLKNMQQKNGIGVDGNMWNMSTNSPQSTGSFGI